MEFIIAYLPALGGGVLIGIASLLYLYLNGRIAGISGILSGLVSRQPDWLVRAGFLAGLVSGGGIMYLAQPEFFQISLERPTWLLLAAGFLVGCGSVIGGGCTSGHGVCGLGRLSTRSMLSVAIFLAIAVIVASLTGGLL